MLSFQRDKNKIKIHLQHGIFFSTEYFDLEINQDYSYQAELLRKALQENLNKHLPPHESPRS